MQRRNDQLLEPAREPIPKDKIIEEITRLVRAALNVILSNLNDSNLACIITSCGYYSNEELHEYVWNICLCSDLSLNEKFKLARSIVALHNENKEISIETLQGEKVSKTELEAWKKIRYAPPSIRLEMKTTIQKSLNALKKLGKQKHGAGISKDAFAEIINQQIADLTDPFNAYFNYVVSEMCYGVKLSVLGAINTFFHPINTGRNIMDACSHPWKTASDFFHYARNHPICFMTTLAVNQLVVAPSLSYALRLATSYLPDLPGELNQFLDDNFATSASSSDAATALSSQPVLSIPKQSIDLVVESTVPPTVTSSIKDFGSVGGTRVMIPTPPHEANFAGLSENTRFQITYKQIGAATADAAPVTKTIQVTLDEIIAAKTGQAPMMATATTILEESIKQPNGILGEGLNYIPTFTETTAALAKKSGSAFLHAALLDGAAGHINTVRHIAKKPTLRRMQPSRESCCTRLTRFFFNYEKAEVRSPRQSTLTSHAVRKLK